MNGIIHYRFDDGWVDGGSSFYCDAQIGNCRHEMKHGELRGFFVEGVPPYFNEYPFEIGADQPPLSEPAEEQIRFAMSVVSNHSDRYIIAARCARQARHMAREVLAEYEGELFAI